MEELNMYELYENSENKRVTDFMKKSIKSKLGFFNEVMTKDNTTYFQDNMGIMKYIFENDFQLNWGIVNGKSWGIDKYYGNEENKKAYISYFKKELVK